MEDPSRQQSLYPGWLPQTPIPGVSLSAGGLLALADLSTVQQRTALTGGSSWLDSLILVPGLHYQQAADELARRTGLPPSLPAVELRPDGSRAPFAVNNAAVSQFCQRVAKDAELVTLDVGPLPPVGKRGDATTSRRRGGPGLVAAAGKHRKLVRGDGGLEAAEHEGDDDDPDELVVPDFGWLSHLLYLMGPLLTLGAIALLVLIHDWWALGCVCALMLSRLLNIWVIKQRAARKAAPHPLAAPPSRHPSTTSSSAVSSSTSASQQRRQQRRHSRQQQQQQQQQAAAPDHGHDQPPSDALVSLLVALPGGREVCLRGTAADLAGAAGAAWLRAKTHVEGYLEAAAKLCVYLVAAVSGNWTQAGALVVMLLLLVSAALLALSNAHATRLDVAGGYVAVPGGRRRRVAVVEPAAGGELAGGVEGDSRGG
ncbi:hypothetical protein RB595_010135 [Gaeumannomyces hyphopodioides]